VSKTETDREGGVKGQRNQVNKWTMRNLLKCN